MRYFTTTFLFAALWACSTPSSAPSQSAPAAIAPISTDVELKASFQIPQAERKGISHTPAVVFTKDGTRLLTATSSNEIAVFEVPSRKLLQRIRFPEVGSEGVAIDRSGRLAVWALKDGGVAVMDLKTEEIIARDPALRVTRVAVSPEGTHVALSEKESIQIRDVRSLQAIEALHGHKSTITNLAWSPDGQRLASTAEDGKLLVHDLKSKKIILELKKDTPLYAVDFHPRGKAVAYGGKDNTVYEYKFGPRCEEVIAKGQPYWITCLGYSPDGERLAVGDESCDIWLFKLGTKELTFHNKHHMECWLSSVAWEGDGNTFLFGCRPNSQAGKPSLHLPLVRAEAAQSAVVREKRVALLKALEAEIEKTEDEKQKKGLEAYRQALAAEESPQAVRYMSDYDVQIATAAVTLDAYDLRAQSFHTIAPMGGLYNQGGLTLQAQPILQQAEISPEVKKLAEEHRKALQAEIQSLQGTFNLNQWRIKK